MDHRAMPDPIEQFFAQAEKRLRGRLEPRKVDAIVAEAREHLMLRARELTAAGLEPDAARAAAAAALGRPGDWARGILISENAPPYLWRAYLTSIAGFALFLLATPIFALMMTTSHRGPNRAAIAVLAIAALSFLAAVLGAAVARRCAVKSLLAITAAKTLGAYLLMGLTMEPLMKMKRQSMVNANAQDSIRADIERLQLGAQIYGSSSLPNAVPETLKADGGFVAPLHGSRPLSLTALANGATEVVASEEVASRQWRDFGASRLAECNLGLAELKHRPIIHMTAWRALSTSDASNFDAADALTASEIVGVQGVGGLALCGIFALLGRLIHRLHTTWSQQRKVRRAPIH